MANQLSNALRALNFKKTTDMGIAFTFHDQKDILVMHDEHGRAWVTVKNKTFVKSIRNSIARAQNGFDMRPVGQSQINTKFAAA